MQNMTEDEIYSFLMDDVRVGKLATVRPDGRPHVVPIWYWYDGEAFYFNTWHTSVKGKNIAEQPQVALCVDEEAPPYAYVMIEGEAAVIDITPEAMRPWSAKIGGRYMGADRAEEFGKRNAVEGELLIKLTPTHIVAKKNIAD